MVFNAMDYLVSKPLAMGYTYEGAKGKKAFKQRLLANLIKGNFGSCLLHLKFRLVKILVL